MPRPSKTTSVDSRVLGFVARWHERFGLPRKGWKACVRKHVSSLPFCDSATAESLLGFLFGELPKRLDRQADLETALLAEALGWVCFSFWQCESAFPSFPENYAVFLRDELLKPPANRNPASAALARMIVPANENAEREGRCGFNQLTLADPEVIRASETLMSEGRYEFYFKAQEKYAEYESHLACSEEFRADWERIKACFPAQTRGKPIIRRSLIPERNWERGTGATFTSAAHRFQAIFDLFCWKYYLWGMRGDEPLLLKTSVVFTPFGTQLFIPGYLSLDAKRDLDISRIARLHRARGISRQGPGFSVGRQELADLRQRAKAADREARAQKLKGDARYRFVCEQIGFRDAGDYRRLRKMLSSDHRHC